MNVEVLPTSYSWFYSKRKNCYLVLGNPALFPLSHVIINDQSVWVKDKEYRPQEWHNTK